MSLDTLGLSKVGPLRTARLRLRRFTLDDAAFIVELLSDPDWRRFIGDRGVRTEDDARRYLAEGPLASYRVHGFGLLAVEDGTGSPVGMCGLLKRDTLPDPDLGFAFLPRARGKGYAREAAAAVLDSARAAGHRRVLAIVTPGNARSIALLERADFAFERAARLADDADEVRVYSLEL
jgi:RimJ/RimL family protein N-acetyltransferase